MVTLKDILKSITQSIKQVSPKQSLSIDQEEKNYDNSVSLIEQYKLDGQKTLDLIEKYMDEHPYLTKNNTTTTNNTTTINNNNNNNVTTNDNVALNTNNTIIQMTTPTIPSNVTQTVANALVNTLSLTNATSSTLTSSSATTAVNTAIPYTPTLISSTATNNINNNSSSTPTPTTPGAISQPMNPLIEEDIETSQLIDKFNVDLYNLYNTSIHSSSSSNNNNNNNNNNTSTTTQGSMKHTTIISCSPEAEKLHHQQFLFLCYYHALLPILGPQRFFTTFWYTKVIQPILSTSSYIEPIKKIARDIVSTSLCIEQQLLRRHRLRLATTAATTIPPTHGVYATQIIQAYLEWIHLREKRRQEKKTTHVAKNNNNDDIRLQHQLLLDMEQEEWSCNLKLILMTLGAQETKTFFYLLNDYFQSSQHRLQIVYLFSEFMLRKRTHAHEILETPLFDSMLKSLMYDNSTTLIAISVTNMIMLLPRICTSLQPYLPKLFYIFARAISWDQLRDLRKKRKYQKEEEKRYYQQQEEDDKDDMAASTTTTTMMIQLPDGTIWDCADFTFSKLAAPPSNPQTGPFFTALYGLYPCQFLHFLHKPYLYFEKVGFQVPEEFDEDMFRNRVINHHVSRHMLHPNLVTMDLDQEVVDRSRWMKMEPPDVIARIMSLDLTNAASRVAFYKNNHHHRHYDHHEGENNIEDGGKGDLISSMDLLDTTLWNTSSSTDHEEEEVEDKEDKEDKEDEKKGKKKEKEIEKKVISTLNDIHHDQPSTSISNQSMMNNILQLNRALKSGTEVLIGDDIWDAHLEKITSPFATTPTTTNTPTTSSSDTLLTTSIPINFKKGNSSSNNNNSEEQKEAIDTLGKNQLFLLSSSPIDSKDPHNNETKLLIAALKREVLLLRNELNFELFLKQQHLQHIARLHREHIMDSTVEAERQQLYNTNRMLKAQLEKTTLLLDQMKSETVLTKQKHIKWEDEQSNKLRGYREARKEWQAHMEKNKTMLQDYQQLVKDQEIQLNHYQSKISQLEMELKTNQPLIDKADHFEQKVKQLTRQMLLWEEDISHVQEQKKYIKGLLSQWWSMEELVASLQHENQQLILKLSQKENQIAHYLSKRIDPSINNTTTTTTASTDNNNNNNNNNSNTDNDNNNNNNNTITSSSSLSSADQFFIKNSSTTNELNDMKRIIQELREKLTESEMEKMKYQAELEIYKSQHQPESPSKKETEEEEE